jgi:hypothetical protein
MRTKTKNKVTHIYFSTLGIRIDHNVSESTMGSNADIRLISRYIKKTKRQQLLGKTFIRHKKKKKGGTTGQIFH